MAEIDTYEINLTEAQEASLCQWIDDQKSRISTNRNQFIERHKRYLYNWDDFVTFQRTGPWEDASNLHMPLTAIKVKSYIARLYNIFSNETTTQLIPRETYDQSYVDMMRRLRSWYLWDYINGYKGVRGFAREAFYDCVTVGYGIGMKDWYVKQRKVITLEPAELKREMEDVAPQIAENQKGASILETEEDLTNRQVKVQGYKEIPKLLTVFEGSRLQTIPFENAYFPSFIPESSDLDYPECVVIETDMTLSDIQLKAIRQEWDKKKVLKVKDMGTQYPNPQNMDLKEHRARLSGYEDTLETNKSKRIIEYAFCSYDIDDDGISEEIVVTKCEKVILKVTLLDRISPSGSRPLFKFDCFSKPRQAYSRGVPEFMYPLNEEMDQHHNMRINYLALQTCPFGVYRGSSSLKNEPIRIAPGKFIPVDEITDMRVLNFNSNSLSLAGEEDRLWHYSDMLSSTSSLNQGIVPEQVGPTRSTSGVLTLLRQMDKEFIVTVDQIADQWKKMEKMLIDDLDYRINPAVKMRVLGASVDDALKALEQPLPNMQVNAAFDMRIDVAKAVTSEEVRRNDEEMILMKLAAPSVLQQMGVVQPKGLYTALTNWLRAYGRDEKEYINPPEFLDKPLTLFQEIQIIGGGQVPPMSMQDDHMAKAQNLIAFMQSQEYAEAKMKGLYPQNTDDVFQESVKKHQVLAEMLKPKNLPNPTGANQASVTQTMAGAAPQQGGENPNITTSRELPQNEPQNTPEQ